MTIMRCYPVLFLLLRSQFPSLMRDLTESRLLAFVCLWSRGNASMSTNDVFDIAYKSGFLIVMDSYD